MAVSSELGLKVVITGVSQVISGLKSIDNAASGLGTVLKGVGKVGSGALKLLTAPLRAIGKVAGLAWKGLAAVAKSIWRIGEYVVGNLIARGITAIGDAIVQLAQDALQAAEDIQVMRIALQGLVAREMVAAQQAAMDLGDAFGGVHRETLTMEEALSQAGPRAEELLLRLRDIALVSPYQFNQIEDTFRLAMAFGMGSEQALDFTQATLDTAAGLGMTNEVLTRFVYNLAQAVIGGDLTAINLRQLRLTSFDLAKVLSDELGLSIEEVREGLKDGSITLADVSDAFLNYADVVWAGAAERMSNTLLGLKNSFLDLFFFVGADTLTPLVEAVSSSLGDVFDSATEILSTGALTRIGEAIGEMAVKGLEMIPFDAIMKAMPTVLDAIALLLEGRFEDAWYTAMAAIQLVFGDEAMVEVHQYKDAYLAAIEVIRALLAGDFKTAWEETKKVIIGVFGPEAQEPIALFEQAIAAIGAAIEIVQGLLAGDIGLKDLVSPGMVEVIEAFEGLLQKISDWFTEYGPGIKEAADEMFTKMQEAGENLAKEVLPWIVEELDKFSLWFRDNEELINRAVLNIIKVIGDWSGKVVEWWAIIAPLLSNFLGNMRGILTFLLHIFAGEWETAWEYIKKVASNAWEGIKEFSEGIWGDIALAFGIWLADLLDTWTERWEDIKEKWAEIWQAILDAQPEWLTKLYNVIIEGIRDAWQGIVDFKDEFVEAGKQLIMGLIEGIKAKAAALAAAAVQAARDAWNAVTGFLGERSPSTLFAEVGRNIVLGLIEGVESEAEEFADVMKGLFDVAGTLSGIGGFFSGVYERQKVDPLRAILKEMNANMDAMAEHKRALEEQIEAEQEQALRDAAALEIEGIEAAQEAQEEAIRATAEAERDAQNDAHSEMLTIIANEFDLRGDKIKEIIALQEDEQKTLYSEESDAIKQQYDDEELLFKDQVSDEEQAAKDQYSEEERLFKEGIDAQEQATKDQYTEEERLLKESIDAQEEAVGNRYDEEARLIKETYDEKIALYRDVIDKEERAIRERDDIEKEERYALLDDVATKERAGILDINNLERAELTALGVLERAELDALSDEQRLAIAALGVLEQARLDALSDEQRLAIADLAALEQAELDAIQQNERDGLREIGDREDEALDTSIAAKEAALAAIQDEEEARIRDLAAKEQAAIADAIALYEKRIDAADEAERIALETLIAQSEAQRDAITERMEAEIAIIEVRMAATEQEIRAEEIRLDIIRQIEEEEARILALKEKQDQLKMLDQQRKLLELIAEYELDAGSILEGLTLGLDADAGDVLDAMTAAMSGIIAALEDTLEISSPSGVFRTIGQQMMAGLSEGVADLTPAVIAQINAAVSPVMSGGGGVTNIYNNNSQMSHNLTTQSITRPGALALEFDAMAMASR